MSKQILWLVLVFSVFSFAEKESLFDKTVCGIALIDSEGNVIFGKIPSVAECKSYDGPNLLVEYAQGGAR